MISPEVQELISYRPHWIVRKGNVIFFFMLVLLLASAWFIEYPDVTRCAVKLGVDNSVVYGRMVVSQKAIGRVRSGQKVLVKLEAYPSKEFGYLRGIVGDVSDAAARSDSFLVKVELPDGLVTNYGRSIRYLDNLRGEAEVITGEERLIYRLLGKFGGFGK